MNIQLNIENISGLNEFKETAFSFPEETGIIRDGEVVIGFFNATRRSEELQLELLEILPQHQQKGYGAESLNRLFVFYDGITKISGVSSADSEGFFWSVGADAYYSCEKCPILECSRNEEAILDPEQHDCEERDVMFFSLSRNS